MPILREYHRPHTAEEALSLLARSEARLIPLAGGTSVVGQLATGALQGVDGVVDLAALGWDAIQPDGDFLHVGALVTLSTVCEDAAAGAMASGLLRQAAHGEGPLNLRNAATVGGVVAGAAYDSEFYTALLALNTVVVQVTSERILETPLAELDKIRGLIQAVRIPLVEAEGRLARVARTPSDRPIVAAVAVRQDASVRIAFCGVAPRPVLDGAGFDAPDDFKGSAAYRRHMADVLRRRVLASL